MSRKPAVWLACVVLLAGSAWSQKKSERERKFAAFEQEAIAREQELAAAEKRHDLNAILATLDSAFSEIGGDGSRYTKASVVRYFPDLRVNDVTFHDFQVQYAGRDGALVTYQAEVDATYQGQPLPPHFAVSSLWVRRGRKWRLLFHQATLAQEMKPAATK